MIARYATLPFLFSAATFAQDPARLDQIAQSYATNNHFMGTVLVAKADQVLLSKGYGSANLEWNIPNTPSTRFRLGSVTKQFTAASILLLEERGKLKVEDPVKKYMPDAPAAWDKITVFNVLTHTSGIPSFTGFPDYASLEPFPTTAEKLVARFRDKPLDFEPGEKWNYSNSGYVLLGYLIEKISGESYAKFVQENIFTPLGMKDSGYDSNSTVIAHRAAGYARGPDGTVTNAGYIDMTVPYGAGALYSTTEDLLRWEQGLFGGKLLSAASLQKMTTPFKNNYAFGLGVHTENGHKLIDHNGGIEGFSTNLAYYPEDKITVVVLSNVTGAASPGEIATKLGAVSHNEPVQLTTERKEITVSPETLGRYVGIYGMGPNTTMAITLVNGQLISQMTRQPPVPLFAESETMFFPKVVDAEIEFPRLPKDATKEHATQLILHQGGRDMTAERLDDAETKRIADSAAAFDKRFKDQTAAPGSEAAVRRMIGELQTGKPNYDLMSPGLADATRQQLSGLQSMINDLGVLQSVTFKGVGPGGADIYTLKFDKGSLDYRVWLAPDGKVDSANVRPSQ
jgi:CubicO group peptidase (beta-lactamase class C family)